MNRVYRRQRCMSNINPLFDKSLPPCYTHHS